MDNNENIIIRCPELLDLPQLLKIQSECYQSDLWENVQSFTAKIETISKFCRVVEIHSEIAAYCLAFPAQMMHFPAWNAQTFLTNPEDADCFYLHDLAISPTWRGRHLAEKLLHAVLASRPCKIDKIFLISVQNSIDFWQKFGFKPISPEKCHLTNKVKSYGDNAILMFQAA